MRNITLVTGNKFKLIEWQRLVRSNIKRRSADIDLDEIQSLDLEAIASDKAKRAYRKLKVPIVVEDIAAGLEILDWLPGPFVKFFQQELGKEALLKLARGEGEKALATCGVAYYDGKQAITAKGEIYGTVVHARGDYGFGFDFCFVPDGCQQTFAEMGPTEKDKISHRAQAIKALLEAWEKLSSYTPAEVKKVRNKKNKARGAFEKGVFLELTG